MIDSFVCGLFLSLVVTEVCRVSATSFFTRAFAARRVFSPHSEHHDMQYRHDMGINSCLYATDSQISLWSGFTVLTVQPI